MTTPEPRSGGAPPRPAHPLDPLVALARRAAAPAPAPPPALTDDQLADMRRDLAGVVLREALRAAPPPPALTVGDVVRLKSGGHAMTIVFIDADKTWPMARVFWSVSDETGAGFETDLIPVHALEAVVPAAQGETKGGEDDQPF